MYISLDENRIINLKNVVFVIRGEKEGKPYIALTTNMIVNGSTVEYIKGYDTAKERDAVYAAIQKAMKDQLIKL